MADIYFYQEEDQDDSDLVYGDSEVTTNPDDLLPPIQKLEKYAESDNIFNRQIIARTILETLRVVADIPEDVEAVLKVMDKLADDVEPSVRAELMEQVPHIAMYCQEFKDKLSHVVPQSLLPMVVKFLTDTNNQVRKTSQAALLVLLEQGLVEKSDVQEQVCPVIIRLTEADSLDDYRTEAVALLSKMAPLIGKEMAESIFLERFANLCVDPLFHVRKVCAANFGDFSSVVGLEPTEQVLLPKFFYLCEDGVWGVRKACADVFMPVSCVCSPAVRQTELSPLFINLLRDQSRWVRMAAFQALGPFISTFADSAITVLLHNDNGEIVITDADLLAQRLDELELTRAEKKAESEANGADKAVQEASLKSSTPEPVSSSSSSSSSDEENETDKDKSSEHQVQQQQQQREQVSDCDGEPVIQEDMDLSEEDVDEEHLLSSDESDKSSSSSIKKRFMVHSRSEGSLSLEEERAQKYQETNNNSSSSGSSSSNNNNNNNNNNNSGLSTSESFNNFQYWREPVPIIEELVQLESSTDSDVKNAGKGPDGDDEDKSKNKEDSTESSTMELFRPGGVQMGPTSSFSEFDPGQQHSQQQQIVDPALPKGPPKTIQDIVPQLLIDHYVSMTDPSRAQTVDSEIARHCAFSLPAVALTLGRSNWPLLKETYESLASDMQWKVRRTLASSIHELGIILGEDAAGQDLIPIFNGFLKDLDEVRIGLLKHLADFLRLFPTDVRREYLPRLAEFLKMDNERNWRFRQELTEQLGLLVPLFAAEEVKEHLAPIAMILVQDKVSAVRLSAVQVHTTIVKALLESDNQSGSLTRVLLSDLVEQLAQSNKWIHRQTFAVLCLYFFEASALDHAQFAQDVLPHLLELAWDSVPNVRLVVARAICTIRQTTYFTKEVNPNHEKLEEACNYLAGDKDTDVRAFFQTVEYYDSDGEPIGDVSSLPV